MSAGWPALSECPCGCGVMLGVTRNGSSTTVVDCIGRMEMEPNVQLTARTERQQDQDWADQQRLERQLAAQRAQRECEAAALDDGLPRDDGPPAWVWLLGVVIAGVTLLWVLRG